MGKAKSVLFKVVVIASALTFVYRAIVEWNFLTLFYPDIVAYVPPDASRVVSGTLLLVFGVFGVVKLFVNKPLVNRIFTTMLAALSLGSAYFTVQSLVHTVNVLLTNEQYSATLAVTLFALLLSVIFDGLLVVACVNAFKPFVSKKTAWALALSYGAVCVVYSVVSFLSMDLTVFLSVRFALNYLLMIVLYLTYIPLLYLTLKND